MTEEEKRYWELCKKSTPFESGSSLHVYGERHRLKVDGRIKYVQLYWAISASPDSEPGIEIKTKKEYDAEKAVRNLLKKKPDGRSKVKR